MEKKIIDNDVFVFSVEPNFSYTHEDVYVYMHPDDVKEIRERTEDDEGEVQRLYFNAERCEKMKQELIDKIRAVDATELFTISCTALDGGYNITEEQLFRPGNILKVSDIDNIYKDIEKCLPKVYSEAFKYGAVIAYIVKDGAKLRCKDLHRNLFHCDLREFLDDYSIGNVKLYMIRYVSPSGAIYYYSSMRCEWSVRYCREEMFKPCESPFVISDNE
jgi:hypothetical protein